MSYRITDAKGDDFYNDTYLYATREEAEKALAEVRAWALEESKREPSWLSADFVVVEEK